MGLDQALGFRLVVGHDAGRYGMDDGRECLDPGAGRGLCRVRYQMAVIEDGVIAVPVGEQVETVSSLK
ncbi:hypothetical protein [Frankia sp. BMG5.23]|jgi:hypothetical protein|uniref:hypothetical protein n=1 Tax=Frankia sp. BMG5.23 TaxID=683305 RepID=UPI0005B77924|nr:hypothetical protein [Frankia sp. BMG5.23]